jgi:hypothetical protein
MKISSYSAKTDDNEDYFLICSWKKVEFENMKSEHLKVPWGNEKWEYKKDVFCSRH